MTTTAALNALAESYLGREHRAYRADCPLCGDGEPVSITIEDDGHVVAHCHRCEENGRAERARIAAPVRTNGAHRPPSARARPTPTPTPRFAAKWDAAPHATSDHPYLTRKRVKAYNLRLDGDKLLLAVRNVDSAIVGLQTIAPDSQKKFAPKTAKTGAYFSIGRPDGRIVICEGYATAASIHEVTGDAVAVAFDCGNLRHVAKALREKYPDLEIVIAADDDFERRTNPGLTHATVAASAVGGRLARPAWPATLERGNGTDFNDLFIAAGADAVRACFESATVPAPAGEWERSLLYFPATAENPNPALIACEFNAALILGHSARFADIHGDTFLQRPRIGDRDLADADIHDALLYLQARYAGQESGCVFEARHAKAALRVLADSPDRQRDVLREFIDALPAWDGTERIALAFCDAWGATDNALMHAASRNFFVAMIARALSPGCQVDTVWVFEGRQGALKSTALRALAGSVRGVSLSTEIHANAGTTDFLRELQGVWLAEMGELDSLRGREASTVKRILSCRDDRWVEKYESYARRHPRRCVISATTNEAEYWQDSTGARRLVPITCGTIRPDLIEANRLQWFAEARAAFVAGGTWWEFPATVTAAQEERQQIDAWEDTLRDGMLHGRPAGIGLAGRTAWPAGWISSAAITRDWLQLPTSQQGRVSSTRLGHVMRRLGYKPKSEGNERGWIKYT